MRDRVWGRALAWQDRVGAELGQGWTGLGQIMGSAGQGWGRALAGLGKFGV